MFFFVFVYLNVNAQSSIKFAVIGDFGYEGQHELDVAELVISWNPDFIITAGDNNYNNGAASTIDPNIGQYYHDFIYPYLGSYGNGSPDSNRFFPVPGNHDWNTPNLQPYIDYFTLPNNERYYDFTWDYLHFFMIDSDGDEPDGNSENSDQAMWIKNKMENSNERWKIVSLHHAPYSSAQTHGSSSTMQWPYKEWGANVVFAGHDHTYERLIVDSLLYFVNGLGGKSLRTDDFSDSTSWVPGSQVRFAADYGAMLVEAYYDSLIFKFYTRTGQLIDNYTIPSTILSVELKTFTAEVIDNNVTLKWSTRNETNNKGFYIERKLNGKFLKIAFIPGHGTTTKTENYFYCDQNLNRGTYTYRLKQIDFNGASKNSNELNIAVETPNKYILNQNYPNPFNPETKIGFQIIEYGLVSLKIYDILGREIATLLNEFKQPGYYEVNWNAKEYESGIYFYRLTAGDFVKTKEMALIK